MTQNTPQHQKIPLSRNTCIETTRFLFARIPSAFAAGNLCKLAC